MTRSTALLVVCCSLGVLCSAQGPVNSHVLQAVVIDGDTVPVVQLPEANVDARWRPRDRREAERYTRLMRHVIKVYPYANLTGQLLKEYENDLSRSNAMAIRTSTSNWPRPSCVQNSKPR